jgi:hypothetical protein
MVELSQLEWLGKRAKAAKVAKVANNDSVTGFGQVGNVGDGCSEVVD